MTATTISVSSKLPTILVHIDPELKTAAEKLAKKRQRSLSSLVRVLLAEAVAADAEGEKLTAINK